MVTIYDLLEDRYKNYITGNFFTSFLYCTVHLFSSSSQMTPRSGKNISDTLAYSSRATFFFSPHFYIICGLLLDRRMPTWNLFVSITTLIYSEQPKIFCPCLKK